MTYTFPPSLRPLSDHLRKLGADVNSFKSDRQAAYMAQQLLGTRVKFPPQGGDMLPTLLKIQRAVQTKGIAIMATPHRDVHDTHTSKPKKQKGKAQRDHVRFTPDMFASGIHIFCDGAAVPNPGVGGWGVVVYRDGIEIDSAFGGDPEATNNQMELTAILNAIEKAWMFVAEWSKVTIWCDSQYCVKGCNEWMPGWKAKGWQRGGPNAEPKNRILLNADLWKAIDEALADAPRFGQIAIQWVKGHAGIVGNERADELAEQGRALVEAGEMPGAALDALSERYRQIMEAT